MTGLLSGPDPERSVSKPSPQQAEFCAPRGVIKVACGGTPALQALSDMSDKQNSTVTRPGGDEGSFVISDNRHMLGIFVSPPGLGSLALGLQCCCGAKHPITASLRPEPGKQPSHLTPAVPVSRWGSKAGFRCCRVCLAFFLQHGKLGKEIARQRSRKSAQVPTHQSPASLKLKGQEMTAKTVLLSWTPVVPSLSTPT